MSSEVKAANQLGPGKYRRDLDGLRGISMLWILIYHNFPGIMPNGYLAIDMFFIVSGLLITRIVIDQIDQGRFTFRNFFERRIRRILPALVVALLATMIAGSVLLLRYEFETLARHFAASLFFFQNVQLMGEAGYFDYDSVLKPLRHVWSLAVEEQFYFVWPALLLLGFALRLDRAWFTLLLVAASFAYANLAFDNLAQSYYSPFARAWELLSGGLAAIMLNRLGWDYFHRWGSALAVAGIALMAIAMLMPLTVLDFATWTPLVPVIGTLLVILGGDRNSASRWLIQNRLVVWTGLISYSLYLWHWPILSFANIVLDAVPSRELRLLGIVLSFALAWISWKFVEEPARRKWSFGTLIGWIAINLALGAALVALVLVPRPSEMQLVRDRANDLMAGWNWIFTENETCRAAYGEAPKTFCYQTRPGKPDVLIIGDSYANQLYPGLAGHSALAEANLLSIGRCHALGGLSAAPDQCELQDRVVEANPEADLIIVGSIWPVIGSDGSYDFTGFSGDAPSGFAQRFRSELLARLRSFAREGRTIVVVGPKPELGYHVKRCFERPLVAASKTCRITREDYDFAAQDRVMDMLREVVGQVPGALLVDPSRPFCNAEGCTYLDRRGLPLLRDPVHFSTLGSGRVAETIIAAIKRQQL